jgi:hypothetical protein
MFQDLKVILVFAAFSAVGVLSFGPPQDNSLPSKVVDLRQLGFEMSKDSRLQNESRSLNSKVFFVDERTMAISFFTRNPNPGMSVRGKVNGGHYLFQTIFMDAESLKVSRVKVWSNSTPSAGLFSTPAGGFVAWHDLDLDLYSSIGTLLKTLSLKPEDFRRGVSISQSPTEETLFASRVDETGHHILRIRTADLEELGWTSSMGYREVVGSDRHFAYLRDQHGINAPVDIYISDDADAQTQLTDMKKVFTDSEPCSSIDFLDEHTLALSGGCHDLTILSITGEVLYQKHFDRALTGPAIPCRKCDLVVSNTYTLSGGNSWLDTFPKAQSESLVLLNRKTRALLELPQTGSVKYSGAIALSPDGRLLAIQTDWELKIYQIRGTPIAEEIQ